MIIRAIRKFLKTLSKYGLKESLRRTWVFFERKVNQKKYFHFIISDKSNSDKNVLFVSGEPKNATAYYRCEIPKAQLEKHGWTADIVHEKFASKVKAADYQAIIFYRTPLAPNRNLLSEAKTKSIPCLFSIDDLVYRADLLKDLDYTNYLDHEDAKRLLDRAEGMQSLMSECEGGIASTQALAEDMSKFIKGPVHVNRNGIINDYGALASAKKQKSGKVILGYFSGSETHDRDLSMVWPTLTKIFDEFQNVEMWVGGRINFVYGEYEACIKKLPFLPREGFMKMHSQVDINLLPLEDTEFNRAKSEIKFTEAALLKVPTIASRVGDLDSIINPKVGVLCKGEEDWYQALKKLISDETLRSDLGNNAREYVLNNYNLEKFGKELSEFLINIIKKPNTNER